jgi:hypothetical protein
MKKITLLLLICFYGGILSAQISSELKKPGIQLQLGLLFIEKSPDDIGLEGLYVVHETGKTDCTHDKKASKLSIKYPKDGKYASLLQKEQALGTLKFSNIYVTDIGDGQGYIMKHSTLRSECEPFKHTRARSKILK